MRERKIVPITLNQSERLLLRELSSQSRMTMCAVVRTLLYREFASRQLLMAAKPKPLLVKGNR